MQPALQLGASLLVGLLAGSLPTGYIAGRLRHLDIRRHGSRNIGFTNVFRVIGAAWAIPVLVIDILKGALPVLLAPRLGLTPMIAGLGAVLGHVYTPWLGFRGGKGVATTIGVCAAVSPLTAIISLGVYALVLLATGYISAGSVVFAVAIIPLTAVLHQGDLARLLHSLVIGTIVIQRHTANIGRLVRGEEPRFGPWLRLFRKPR